MLAKPKDPPTDALPRFLREFTTHERVATLTKELHSGKLVEEWNRAAGAADKKPTLVDMSPAVSSILAIKDEEDIVRPFSESYGYGLEATRGRYGWCAADIRARLSRVWKYSQPIVSVLLHASISASLHVLHLLQVFCMVNANIELQKSMRTAANLTSTLLRHYVLQKLETILDREAKISHEAFASQIEARLGYGEGDNAKGPDMKVWSKGKGLTDVSAT